MNHLVMGRCPHGVLDGLHHVVVCLAANPCRRARRRSRLRRSGGKREGLSVAHQTSWSIEKFVRTTGPPPHDAGAGPTRRPHPSKENLSCCPYRSRDSAVNMSSWVQSIEYSAMSPAT